MQFKLLNSLLQEVFVKFVNRTEKILNKLCSILKTKGASYTHRLWTTAATSDEISIYQLKR